MTDMQSWRAPAPAALADGPLNGAERPILEGFLAWERSTMLNICAGLSTSQLVQRPIPSSNLSLLGLLRHLAKVERIWFRQRVAAQLSPPAGEPVPPLFDPQLPRDTDFNDLRADDAPGAIEQLLEESRRADEAVAGIDFDSTFTHDGDQYSLRLVYIHMIAEYSRHNGHADLLRESLDGVTGR